MRPALAAAALATAAALAACSGAARDAERAVRAYDEALVAAFRTGDAARMAEVAGADEARRVTTLVAVKADARVVLESSLEAFEVVKVEVPSAGTARVEARERWRYFDRPLDPGAPAGAPIESAMTMQYDVAREGGRWKVQAVRTVASDGARLRPTPAGAH